MYNMLKIELRKAVKNKFLWISVALGFAVTIMSFLYNYESYNKINEIYEFENQFNKMYNHLIGLSTLYNNWVGGEAFTMGSSIYFYIFPILIAIPYGWSYCAELKNGYVKNMIIRAGRASYYSAKYIATFIAGGLAMVLPMIFNFMLTACFIPATKPDPTHTIYYGVFPNSLMSDLLYTKPLLYVLIYLLINFVFCGLIACLSCTIANWIKNKVVAVLFPFALLLGFHYMRSLLTHRIGYEVSPMNFLHPAPVAYQVTWTIIIIEAAVLFLITFLPTVVRRLKHEVY